MQQVGVVDLDGHRRFLVAYDYNLQWEAIRVTAMAGGRFTEVTLDDFSARVRAPHH